MEEKEISRSNKLKIIVITAVIFLVSIAGISYAYFTIQIIGNETASSMRLRTANMQLIYNDVQISAGDYAEPGWSDTKTLTVYNAGNVTAYYNIIWRDLYNEIINGELVISATCSASSGSCSNMSERTVPTSMPELHNISVKRGILIAPGVTHTYTLTQEFKETGSNQNYNQNKYFNGTLNIADGNEPATVSLLTDQGTSGLSTGDVVRLSKNGMENQDFNVVSTNASETVLISKYNLLVGDIFDYSNNVFTFVKTLSPSDSGYGLQSETAKGYVPSVTRIVGVVPFSGLNYWDERECQYVGTVVECTGTSKLKDEYALGGASYRGTIEPYVYNFAMSNEAPSIDYTDSSEGGLAQNNGYTIAYYVERYMDTLGIDGTGKILSAEEAISLGCSSSDFSCSSAPSWFNNGSAFWIASAAGNVGLIYVQSSGSYNSGRRFAFDNTVGVRPAIVVNTSDIQNN